MVPRLNFIPLWERKGWKDTHIKSHPVIGGTGAPAAASVTVIQVALLEMDGVLW
jgi:hypothetical protein